MTDRQKFWLKVALFVTTPVWVPLGVAAMLVAMPFACLWMMVDEIVDPLPRRSGRGGGR